MSGGTGNGQQYIALGLGKASAMKDADLYYCDGTELRMGAIQQMHSGPAYYNVTVSDESILSFMSKSLLQ